MFASRSYPFQVRIAACSVLALAMSVNVVAGAVIHTRAVRVNEKPIARTPHVVVNPGDQVDIEFYASGWGVDIATVKTWQVKADVEGYFSGDQGRLNPLGWEAPFFDRRCQADDDCGGGRCQERGTCGFVACQSDADCVVPFACDVPGIVGWCVGANFERELGGFINAEHPEFIFSGISDVIAAVSFYSYNFLFGATLFLDDGPADGGGMYYLCTLRLVVSDDALGVFTVGTSDPQATFLANRNRVRARLVFDPVAIEVATDLTLRVGACCVGRRSCEDLTQSDCAQRGGLWQSGQACGVGKQSCLRARRLRKTAQD